MAGEVEEAVRAFRRRKMAAGPHEAIDGDGDAIRAFAARLGVGLDLDVDEVAEASACCFSYAILSVALDIDVVTACQGTWLEGFYTGLILAQRREEGS